MDIKRIADNSMISIGHRQLSSAASFHSSAYNLFLTVRGCLRISSGRLCTEAPLLGFYSREAISLAPDGVSEYILLQLHPQKILALSRREDLLTAWADDLSVRSQLLIREALTEMLSLSGDPSGQAQLGLTSLVLRIVQLLMAEIPGRSVCPDPRVPLKGRRASLYLALRQYIHTHAGEQLSEKGTAELFHITPQYLGSFLKESSGMTFRGLVTEERMQLEEQLRRYASDQAEAYEEAPGHLLNGGGAESRLKTEENLREIQLHAGIHPLHALPQFFRKLINLGYAANLRSLDLDDALDLTHAEIGFDCGRICRITDLITAGAIRGRSYYDFSAVFALLDRLIARGITPFLELGNKSFLIQESTVISYAPVSPTDTKAYYRDLLHILPEFARAAINHYGQSEFDRWYFEISFMYTSSEEREQFGLVQYAGMFRKIYSVLRSFSNTCHIGGPGFNDWSDPSRIPQMIRLMSSHGVVPDFFSAYVYPMTTEDSDTMHLSDDPDEGIRRMRLFAEAVHKEYPHHEVWITEFNSNLSSRNYLNDAAYQAAYIARMMFGAMQLHISGIGYYLLSDAPLRYLDSLDFLFGGWGLLTDRGLPKPSFHAYRLMSKLGHYQIRLTDSCLITANSRGSFQLLLYRYQHPVRGFCFRNVDKKDLSFPAAVFGPGGIDRFQILISHVLKGTYLVREYHINETEANIYSVWQELEYLYPPNAVILKELELRSSLVPHTSVLRLGEGEPFRIELELRGIELVLITVDLYASHT